MNIVDLPSLNFDERNVKPDMLVLHYTGMPSAQAALDKLRDGNTSSRVSAHYVVDEDGTVYRLVPEDKRAWHAGVSAWRGKTDINARSIGIEIVNPGHEFGYRPFPPAQMQAVAELSKDIVARHHIPKRNVVAHSDVAPGRKEDPGELFDWRYLAEQGIGLWPDVNMPPPPRRGDIINYIPQCIIWAVSGFSWFFIPGRMERALGKSHPALRPLSSYGEIQAMLLEYGYNCPVTGTLDPTTREVIIAFQRHFHPKRLTGVWDRQCAVVLESLLSMV